VCCGSEYEQSTFYACMKISKRNTLKIVF
jgi:hypothetical protein